MRYQAGGAKSPPFGTIFALAAITAASAGLSATPAHAGGTPAGSNISSVATATYDLPSGQQASVDSNTVTLLVDELLDVTAAAADPGDVGVSPEQTARVLSFTITNPGNGPESYGLATIANAGGDDFDPTVTAIVLDTNGNNAYDAGVDTVYVAGSNDPQLQPDQSLTVFVLATIPSTAQDNQRGRVDLTAVSKTGSGTPGTTFAGAGFGGGNAVAGASGADAEASGYYRVSRADISFVKAASVADPYGGTTQAPGAVITYTLTATVSGSGSLANVKVADAIPTGTTYQAGTITLDGSGLSDAADADTGRYTGSGIEVGLGTLAAGASKIITFKVKID
ncbi:MAG TPA: hypothetical protein VF727_08880 [Allosphingosinicella sp.]|jgi:uncharacterized repeat protein (TIGR01451 family)